MKLTIRQIADALDLSKSRIEQWISRKYFRPPTEPLIGMARDWGVSDAMRLAIMKELVDGKMTPESAGYLVQSSIYGFKDDVAFFVCWQGARNLAIYPNGPDNEPLKSYTPGHWYNDTLRGSDLVEFLGNPDVVIGTVICLDNLERQVQEALSNAGAVEG